MYADDVVLLSWTAAGLHDLLDSMHAFCLSLGLTISPSKTEVVVFNGSSSDTWHVGQHVLPRSASLKYLGIVFHESGGMTEALARLLQNGEGAAARLSAKHKQKACMLSRRSCSPAAVQDSKTTSSAYTRADAHLPEPN